MHKKQLALTTVFSSLLTIAFLATFFTLSGYADAQSDMAQTGEGIPNTAVSSAQTTTAPSEPDLANAPALSHWSILGSHLLPRGSGATYSYGGNGCMYLTSSGSVIRMQFPVTLPDGATIKSMDVVYYDSSASDLTMWLTVYEPGTLNNDLLAVSSSGNSGIGNSSSIEITHTVDNLNSYSLNYSWAGVQDSTLQICGIRINYIDPFHATFIPAALQN